MPKPDKTPNEVKITADTADGTLRLSTVLVEVGMNESVRVVITDTPDFYLYASENSANGQAAGCWGRDNSGFAENTFDKVNGEHYNIVYAVAKNSAKSVTYGPVITVKPKG